MENGATAGQVVHVLDGAVVPPSGRQGPWGMAVITGEGESLNKWKQEWNYDERRTSAGALNFSVIITRLLLFRLEHTAGL